jgi:hypothetical protein
VPAADVKQCRELVLGWYKRPSVVSHYTDFQPARAEHLLKQTASVVQS